ncbi:MAG: ABC transporter ATP-binding protein [Flavobacteriales bacterium]|nr:ABC transporter ATP-binding protein [Flavobacteriales bacterium]
MGPVVIEVEGLGKSYRLGSIGSGTIADELRRGWARLRGRTDPDAPVDAASPGRAQGKVFHALSDVSFRLREGEVLGIIGRNGAGKSTLLKLLSRITAPSGGFIRMKGRVASLLEVGTGFHPDLTGRENIYLNGAILGMHRREIDTKLAEIIAFSGIEHHIDTPVKRYSSGMKVRLGFAVAAHLEPEILIVDEVLAVGDAEFQRKCLGKMKDVSTSGRTILFVSHNMTAVLSLCTRVVWIDGGRVAADGPPEDVMAAYLGSYAQGGDEVGWVPGEGPGTDLVRLTHAAVVPQEAGAPLTMRSAFTIRIGLENRRVHDDDLNIGLRVVNDHDLVLFASTQADTGTDRPPVPHGRFEVDCLIPGDLMNEGSYHVMVSAFRGAKLHFMTERVLSFTVHAGERRGAWFGRQAGLVRPRLNWTIQAADHRG